MKKILLILLITMTVATTTMAQGHTDYESTINEDSDAPTRGRTIGDFFFGLGVLFVIGVVCSIANAGKNSD